MPEPEALKVAAERGFAVPPAWTDVWVCADPNGHIQVTGVDDAGRTQYLYHPRWVERRDRIKFERAAQLAEALPAARARVTRDLRSDGLTRDRVLAGAFRIIDRAFLRVGSEEYMQANGTLGLTTLLCRNVRVDDDTVAFRFPGKGGKRWDTAVTDADLAKLAAELRSARSARSRFLAWRGGAPRGWHVVTAADVNQYIREQTGDDFTAKDFRTLAGTELASELLAKAGPPRTKTEATRTVAAVCRDVAALLGNSPTVARNSYIDPRVLDRYRHGRDPRG